MVKDHSDSEKGNPLPPHRLLLSINSKGSFIYTIPIARDRTNHRHMKYDVQLVERVILYALSHRQDRSIGSP